MRTTVLVATALAVVLSCTSQDGWMNPDNLKEFAGGGGSYHLNLRSQRVP